MKKTKSPGFFVPMDIPPGEDGSTVDYATLKDGILRVIELDYGDRCETKDVEDFTDLEGKTEILEGRCIVCLVYERFDKLWELFELIDEVS